MNFIKKTIFILALGLLMASCEQQLQGPNLEDNPNELGALPTDNLLKQAELITVYLAESDASRYSAIGSNYIAGLNNQWSGYESYVFTPTDFDALWSNLYLEGLTQARLAKAQGTEEGNNDAIATASFFEALILGELAASFGNIPDSEAVNDIAFPVYDNQATVLQHVQQLLDDAITFGNGSTLYIADGEGGTISTSSLGKLARSLKARYYLLTKEYSKALTQAQAGISSNGAGLQSVHIDAGGAVNLYYNFGRLSRPGDTGTKGAYLEDLVNPAGTASRILNTPGEASRYAFYFDTDGDYNFDDTGIFGKVASLPIISWYETKLIQAEAAHRTNNTTMALNTLNEVRTALATQYSDDFPASTASGNTLLLQILEEKYITLYPSAQTFHDIARTNNALGVPLKTGSQQPQRFLYPQNEIDVNVNTPSPIPNLFAKTPINQ